ncbi:hypothetical protein Dpo_8c00760 [Desulfotignum phosphitoxidans DSM 13687]|uniref:Uncharacterized protein n=2 Tax=Desulfotignum phosphitoxidans TaxID=190898 RepID=S0FYX6_9BACT|nr:hypothetical protein Dpo_8c00760 [Desulfotignum phosphitoxidans DSM 13687]
MILIANNCESIELPEFFGVYANKNGILTEMIEHPNSSRAISGIEVLGAGLMDSLSGILFEDGKLEFIVFLNKVKIGERVPVIKIDRIVDGESKKEKYRVSEEKIMMRVAPIPNISSDKEIFRIVPKESLEAGIWAITIENKLYDFVIKDKSYSDCKRRVVNSFAQINYIPCDGESNSSPKNDEKTIEVTFVNGYPKNDVVTKIKYPVEMQFRLSPSFQKTIEIPAYVRNISLDAYKMSVYRKNSFSKGITDFSIPISGDTKINLNSYLK